jgi:hypothetical protein
MTDTRFKKGQSGNNKGRPPDRTTGAILRKTIAENMQEIINSLIDAAKGGDVQAAKVLLDKVCPSLKPIAQTVNIAIGDTLAETGGNCLAETFNGNIPPDIGSQLIIALSNQAKIIEQQEVIERLQRIERQLENRKP